MNQPIRYYIIDTETTGVSATDGVCEVAFMEIAEDFSFIESAQSLIDPECRIPQGAMEIHGITNQDVEDSPTLHEYFTAKHVACRGKPLQGPSVVLGHNVDFDIRFLKPYLPDLQQPVCTLRWARRLYPHATDHKLQTLLEELNLPKSEGAHRAMADVLSVFHLAKHLCERMGVTLPELVVQSAIPTRVDLMPFGKHKGRKMTQVPRNYLSWMRRDEKDWGVDMNFTLNVLLGSK